MARILGILKVIDTSIEKASTWILVVSVFSMLFFSVLTIVLRWMGTGLSFVEPLVRHLVFLCTFLGGVIATGRGTHIGIDIVGKYLESRGYFFLCACAKRGIMLASFFTLVWLIYASCLFVKVELEFGRDVFFGISSGQLVGIIPFGFGLIAFRFFYIFANSFSAGTGHIVGNDIPKIKEL